MAIVRLKYIHKFKDRHGKTRYYFRKQGGKSIPLPAPENPDFYNAYINATNEYHGIESIKIKSERLTKNSLVDLIQRWQGSRHFTSLSENSRKAYARLLARLAEKPYASEQIGEMRPRHIRMIQEDFSHSAYISNRIITLISLMMQFAISLGLIESDPTLGIRKIKIKSDGHHSWTDEEITAYRKKWVSGTPQRLALELFLCTGQRRSDVARMKYSDICNGMLRVKQQKTGEEIFIPIHKSLSTEIEKTCSPHDEALLLAEKGSPYKQDNFYRAFISWCQAASLPRECTPHGLRKASARILAEAGCTPHQIAAITGHKTLAEVERYTRAAEQKSLAKEAIHKADFIFRKPKK